MTITKRKHDGTLIEFEEFTTLDEIRDKAIVSLDNYQELKAEVSFNGDNYEATYSGEDKEVLFKMLHESVNLDQYSKQHATTR